MRIHCYGCKTAVETDFITRCPKCSTRDIGIEEGKAWHEVSKLFARSKGSWDGEQSLETLPQWFEKHPKRREEWEALKAKLTDPEAIPLPSENRLDRNEAYSWWFVRSGVLSLWWGGASTMGIPSLINAHPLIDTLALAFVDFHNRKHHLGERKNQSAPGR